MTIALALLAWVAMSLPLGIAVGTYLRTRGTAPASPSDCCDAAHPAEIA